MSDEVEFKNTLARLSAPFNVMEVKQRQGGGKMLDYIDWTTVVRRLNDVCPTWDMRSVIHSIHSVQITKSGKQVPGFAAVVEVSVSVPSDDNASIYGSVTRCGVGAGVSDDIDMAVKTAQAEALKKASNQFGMALELWDSDHRDDLKSLRDALKNEDVATLKRYLADAIPDFKDAKDKAVAFREFYALPADADINDFTVIEPLINGYFK